MKEGSMHTALVGLKSFSPYSQSAPHTTPKLPKELADAYEKRTWQARLHRTPEGLVFIPPMAFKFGLSDAAQYLGEQIPGKGKQTYRKHFDSGILIADPLVLDVKADEVEGEWFLVPSDGRRGGGKRVWKRFTVIPAWEGQLTIHVIDDIITQDLLHRTLEAMGSFIGIGRFRPQNNGFYGRFSVTSLHWS
jgi:hypothetical protein